MSNEKLRKLGAETIKDVYAGDVVVPEDVCVSLIGRHGTAISGKATI